ncbi:hypothetical protein GCM10022226_62910 [Sphaerisporangium flaviroseum]|uniref:Pyrrolo-quinoline quinone repeat domain-containing protein n=1 Tax=Sphaerisporangium flaviroseum TaxID=509199 RepID=A0ABP7J3R9_9ACTN
MLVLVVIAAVVLVIRPWGGGGGGDEAGGGNEAGSGEGTAEELTGKVGWQVAADSGSARDLSGVLGSWSVPGAVVRADDAAIVSRDAASGEQRWGLRPPQGGKFCGVSQEASDGVVALAYGLERELPYVKNLRTVDCSGVVLVDLATGKTRWQADLSETYSAKTLRRIGGSRPRTISLAIAEGTVAVAYYWSMVGLSLDDGATRWEVKQFPTKAGDSTCVFTDVLVGPAGAVTLASCDRAHPIALVSFDPGTGKQRWRTDLSAAELGSEMGSGKWLVAADPVVVAVPKGDGPGKYLVLGDTGQVTTTISQTGSYGTLDMRAIGLSGGGRYRYRTVVSGDTLVTATEAAKVSDLRDTNSLVAFDLASGRPRWSKGLSKTSTTVPAVVDRDTVIAVRTGNYEEPPQAYRLKLADGSGGPMGPAYGRELIYTPANCLYRFTGNGLFLVSNLDRKMSAALLR